MTSFSITLDKTLFFKPWGQYFQNPSNRPLVTVANKRKWGKKKKDEKRNAQQNKNLKKKKARRTTMDK